MASNFEAKIIARLDKQQFDKDIAKIQSTNYDLSNVHINTNNLVQEIQNALSRTSFSVNINPIINPNIVNNIGQNLGQNLSQQIRQGIDGVVSSNILHGAAGHGVNSSLERLLGGIGMNGDSISTVLNGLSRDIGSVNLRITSMREQFEDAADAASGLRNFRISGIDELGNMVTILTRINAENGEIASSLTTVTQNFDHSADAAREARQAYQDLHSMATRIGKLELDIIKADEGSNEIFELRRQLDALRQQYDDLYSRTSHGLSDVQLRNLGNVLAENANKASLLRAELEDVTNAVSNNNAFNGLMSLQRQIGSLSTDVAKLNPSKNANQIAELRSQIDALTVEYIELYRASYMDLSDDQLLRLDEVARQTGNQISLLNAKLKDTSESIGGLQYTTLDNKMSTWLQKNSRAVKDYGDSINSLRSKLKTLYDAGKLTKEEFDKIEKEFKEFQQAAISAGKVGKSFGTTLKNAFQGILGIVSVGTILDRVADALREMAQEVYNIDTAMTELKKVTDDTEASYSKFLKSAGSSAKEIGTSVSALVNSTADFARLGYTLSEAQDLAKVANIYNVVGDDIGGIDEATKSIISTLVAFNVEASNSISIVDKFNSVGNNFAISSGGIGTALENSAASLAAANNTLDESIALITAANTVVQNPESVGTAFKTLSMRIRGAATDLENAGLDTDGMAASVSELREEIMALSGVDIMLNDDEFKSTYQILKELSKVWDNLTDVSQANITELLAGKRQGNIMSSLMRNFDIAEKVLKTSVESSGSAMQEHSKWMESLDAKIQQFQASWQELSMTVLESDFLKGLVDTGTTLLNVLTEIVDTLGIVPTLLTGIGVGGAVKGFIENLD